MYICIYIYPACLRETFYLASRASVLAGCRCAPSVRVPRVNPMCTCVYAYILKGGERQNVYIHIHTYIYI